jgi:hypothetical protein
MATRGQTFLWGCLYKNTQEVKGKEGFGGIGLEQNSLLQRGLYVSLFSFSFSFCFCFSFFFLL